jgi:WhiB family redox-sensing transcriptional regulator
VIEIASGDLDWQLDANCRGTDAAAFFPDEGAPSDEAKRICQRCTVRRQCLEYAVTRDIRWGVWGSTNETERKALIRAHKQRKAAA